MKLRKRNSLIIRIPRKIKKQLGLPGIILLKEKFRRKIIYKQLPF